MNPLCIGATLLLLGLMSVGCGHPGPTGGPRETTYPVTGIIHVDGEPAEGVDVVFVPQADAKRKRTSSASSDGDGTFFATTYVGNDGLPEGTYKLAFVFDVPSPSAVMGERKDRFKGAYKDAAKSKFEVTVEDAEVDMGIIELTTRR